MTSKSVNGGPESNSGLPAGLVKPPAKTLGQPNMFCLFCCQLFKKEAQEGILPAITMTVIFVQGFPVPVPCCINHLEVPSTSALAH